MRKLLFTLCLLCLSTTQSFSQLVSSDKKGTIVESKSNETIKQSEEKTIVSNKKNASSTKVVKSEEETSEPNTKVEPKIQSSKKQ